MTQSSADRGFKAFTIVCVTVTALVFVTAIAWRIANRDKVLVNDVGMSPTIESGEMVHVKWTHARVRRGDVVDIDTDSAPGWEHARDVRVLRVIGVSGDRIEQCADVLVCVNGETLREVYLPRAVVTEFPAHGRGSCYSESPLFGCIVPDDSLYVLGDNRQHVHDSRLYGPIPKRAIEGVID
jgi:signal peptidase I